MRPLNLPASPGPVVRLIHSELAAFDVRPAISSEMHEARAFAARLIGPEIVSAAALERVHARSGAGLFLAKEGGELTGVLAFVLLSRAGLAAVWDETFDALDPPDACVSALHQNPVALYGWGVAATTKASAGRVIEGAQAMWAGAVAGLPYFARPTTPRGERLMRERLNFEDLPGSRTGLVWLPPERARRAAA